MKKNAVFYIFYLTSIIVCNSCHYSSDNHTTYGGTLSCSVNGVPFNATKCEAYSGLVRFPVMTIIGAISNLSTSSASNPIINIAIYIYVGVGNYKIGPYPNQSILNIYIDSSISVIGSEYGTLTVDSISPNIVGTFSFTASDSTKVTNGRFSVPAPK